MSEPFLGEIRIFSFNFAPKGWATCLGQLLPINQNQALFSLLGTTFGGNGQTNFALPNAAGRCFLGFSQSYPLGTTGGEANHALTDFEIPSHSHSVAVSSNTATSTTPATNVYGNSGTEKLYVTNAPMMSAPILGVSGGGQPHNNQQPGLAMTFCIALQGIFPSHN